MKNISILLSATFFLSVCNPSYAGGNNQSKMMVESADQEAETETTPMPSAAGSKEEEEFEALMLAMGGNNTNTPSTIPLPKSVERKNLSAARTNATSEAAAQKQAKDANALNLDLGADSEKHFSVSLSPEDQEVQLPYLSIICKIQVANPDYITWKTQTFFTGKGKKKFSRDSRGQVILTPGINYAQTVGTLDLSPETLASPPPHIFAISRLPSSVLFSGLEINVDHGADQMSSYRVHPNPNTQNTLTIITKGVNRGTYDLQPGTLSEVQQINLIYNKQEGCPHIVEGSAVTKNGLVPLVIAKIDDPQTMG